MSLNGVRGLGSRDAHRMSIAHQHRGDIRLLCTRAFACFDMTGLGAREAGGVDGGASGPRDHGSARQAADAQ
jgi:hypothetical protein